MGSRELASGGNQTIRLQVSKLTRGKEFGYCAVLSGLAFVCAYFVTIHLLFLMVNWQ